MRPQQSSHFSRKHNGIRDFFSYFRRPNLVGLLAEGSYGAGSHGGGGRLLDTQFPFEASSALAPRSTSMMRRRGVG